MVEKPTHDVGSSNIFADLGLPNPAEHLAKAELASRINGIIRQRRLTQAATAQLPGIDQPKVSRLLRCHLTNFSTDRPIHFLNLLGRDVEIVV
jgi:predicted XRE-type DNA-binding protein